MQINLNIKASGYGVTIQPEDDYFVIELLSCAGKLIS